MSTEQTLGAAPKPMARWVPAVAAVGLLGSVLLGGVVLGFGGDQPATPEQVPADEEFVNAVAGPALAVPSDRPPVISTIDTTAPTRKTQMDRTLSKGVVGEDVTQVQQRLTDLGFLPGPIDGVYGDETIKSVWAYEKLVLGTPSNAPTGLVTPDMWDQMQDPFVIQPRRPNATPNHTEVYLPEQVLAIFHDDRPIMITHMSSGSNEEWCEEVTISPGEYGNRSGEDPLVRGECGVSTTPGGVFTFDRQIEGVRESALGGLWNPSYFNYGIAIHGAINVPLQGVSHGCIRVPLDISEDLQDLLAIGDQIFVWDGVEEPETHGAQLPTFNWLDPDYVSTSTTVPETTTTVPETTMPATPETTSPVAATTTAAPPTDTATTTSTTTSTTVPVETTTTTIPDPEPPTTTTTVPIADGSAGPEPVGDPESQPSGPAADGWARDR